MKSLIAFLFTGLSIVAPAGRKIPASAGASLPKANTEYYAIRIYQLQTALQEARVDSFLQMAFLPALHRRHLTGIGVFSPVGNDTAAIRRVYVFIPLQSLEEFEALPAALAEDPQYQADGRSYLTANYDSPPYVRMETILLRAFPDMPRHAAPWSGQGFSPDRIYELRSYEGPTENYFANKVKMFNQGGEITLFEKLGFHAVFYASVISGPVMPNLMYMTSFENKAARDEHWKAFGSDPTWKSLSSSPEYQHNVSHIDDLFLHALPFSEL